MVRVDADGHPRQTPIHAPTSHSPASVTRATTQTHVCMTAMQAPSTHHAGTNSIPPVSSVLSAGLEVRPACSTLGRYVMLANDV